MNGIVFLDACALIAFLAGEHGAEKVSDIIQDAVDEKITLKIHQINLLEVYYHTIDVYGQDRANQVIEKINEYPIEIIIGLTSEVFQEAGRIKSKYRIPLGDSIAVGACIIEQGTLVTSDHTDLKKVEKEIKIHWFR